MTDVITRAKAALEQFQWRPIETAPKDGTRVLLFVPPYGAMSGHFDQWWNCHSCLYPDAEPALWMPLPPAPESTNAD